MIEKPMGRIPVKIHNALSDVMDGIEELRERLDEISKAICVICRESFSIDEWDSRHSADDGEDIHEACCESVGPCSWENHPISA
jgi:hypothetical protein